MLQKVGRGGPPKCMYSSEWLGTLGVLANQDLEASKEEFRLLVAATSRININSVYCVVSDTC
jgi:hypothetical protein